MSQPTLGQISGCCAGTWQNFVYIESRVTKFVFTLKPSLANCCWATSATLRCCVAWSETARNVCVPSYFPLA